MELKNILRMTKTDRYTQDGRDELAKLQETEDVKYKTGDISQKTGLQKQPDGSWAPPKKGGKSAAKEKPEANKMLQTIKSAEGLGHMKQINGYDVYKITSGPNKGKYNVSKSGSDVEKAMTEKEALKTIQGSKLESDFDDEGDSAGTNWQEKVEQNPRDGYNFEKMIQHRIPTSQTDKEELKGLRSFMNEEKATYQNALKSRAQALVAGHKSNGDWYPEKEQAIMKIAKAVGFDEELHKFIEEENRGYDLGYSEDAAPKIRELTGDTRIRVKK